MECWSWTRPHQLRLCRGLSGFCAVLAALQVLPMKEHRPAHCLQLFLELGPRVKSSVACDLPPQGDASDWNGPCLVYLLQSLLVCRGPDGAAKRLLLSLLMQLGEGMNQSLERLEQKEDGMYRSLLVFAQKSVVMHLSLVLCLPGWTQRAFQQVFGH